MMVWETSCRETYVFDRGLRVKVARDKVKMLEDKIGRYSMWTVKLYNRNGGASYENLDKSIGLPTRRLGND
jgi:hypothetical protein